MTDSKHYYSKKIGTILIFSVIFIASFWIGYNFLPQTLTVHAQVDPSSVNYRYVINEGTMDGSMPFARGGNSNLSAHGFRFSCVVSHFSYDDPVVFPGQPGRAHLHMFFGNTLTDYNSTSESILNTGASTCGGGVENRSSYWVPAVINEAGEVVLPRQIMNYYKSWVSDRSQIRPIPNGLEILADDTIQGSGGVVVAEPGRPEQTWSGSIRVSDHDGLTIDINFPDCIAVDSNGDPILSSPGGTSHVAYSRGAAGCPSSHPYLIPQLTQTMNWNNVPYESNWQLSSDPSPAEQGTTAHADYVAAWNPEALQIMVDCVRDGYRECGPEITSTMERDFTTTAYGEDAYRWLILREDANATPLGVWPSYIDGTVPQTPHHTTPSEPDPSQQDTQEQSQEPDTQHGGSDNHTDTGHDEQKEEDRHNEHTDTTYDEQKKDDEDKKQHSSPDDTIKYDTDDKETKPSNRITITENLNVRNEPAENNILKVMPARSAGTVLSPDAVFRNNLEWIKVQFDDSTEGYVAKRYTVALDDSTTSARNREDIIRAEISRLLQQLRLLQSLLDEMRRLR